MNSEFPETRFSKIGNKLGWVFSPLLLVSLIAFTLFSAERLEIKFDTKKITVERKGALEINGPKDATIFTDNKEKGKAPMALDIDNAGSVEVSLRKDGRINWTKAITPKPGFVKTIQPILYPKNIDFNSEEIPVNNVYKSDSSNFFFYETIKSNKVSLYRYSIVKQIFGVQVKNDFFADITSLVTQPATTTATIPQESSESRLKNYQVLPSKTGKYILLQIIGEKAVILDEKGNITTLNITPGKNDSFLWSPTDSHIIYKTNQEIYAYGVTANQLLVINKPKNADERVEIQFMLEGSFVYKIENKDSTDLVRNSYEGNSFKNIDLPNIDNIRKGNLVKAYNFLEKLNLILIQTKENIYSYNTTTYELRKFNRFKGEEIVFADPTKQVIITINTINNNQFRSYDLEQNEPPRTFRLNDAENKDKPHTITGFIGSESIVFTYENKLVFADSDGTNPITYAKFNNPEIVLAIKVENNIEIIIKDIAPNKAEIFPSPTPTPSTPSPKTVESQQRFVLKIEKFEN